MNLKKVRLVREIVPAEVYQQFFRDDSIVDDIEMLRLSEETAADLIEEETGYVILKSSYTYRRSFKEKFPLPRAPLAEIKSVKTVSLNTSNEIVTELSEENYMVYDSEPAEIEVNTAGDFVVVEFDAGYNNWEALPPFFKQMLLKATSYFYFLREPFSGEKLYELDDLTRLLSVKRLFFSEEL
jgi:hypothetical protein